MAGPVVCGASVADEAPRLTYDRALLVATIVYHQRASIERCACGWSVLGASWAEHVVDVYEMGAAEL